MCGLDASGSAWNVSRWLASCVTSSPLDRVTFVLWLEASLCYDFHDQFQTEPQESSVLLSFRSKLLCLLSDYCIV
jgi:hypothetical protein